MTRSDTPTFADILARRITRRRLLQAAASLAPLAAAGGGLLAADDVRANGYRGWSFEPIAGSAADEIVLPKGYTYDIIARWGESLWSSTPDLDATKLAAGVLFEPEAAARQARQFGQNCDAVQYFPLDRSSSRGILCVNNEYTDDALMFPGHPGFVGAVRGLGSDYVRQHPGLVAVAKAAQGVSIIEIERQRGRWRMVKHSRFNRRITAQTPIEISGPARGSALMRTRDDPKGVRVLGTFGNCAGGRTPWGTYLTAEENIQDYFGHLAEIEARDDSLREAHRRFRMWKSHSLYGWEVVDPRFDLRANPCEPFRFGWIVEIDPHDPTRPLVKRTALGRFAHESASPIVAHDGRVAVYMGDDDKFEYVYKFVSVDRFDPKNPQANRNLLDRGTLYVARFEASGKGRWLPLVFDPKGPLNAAAGFADQAQVLIKARAAADILGATPMDRPEDVEVNPVTGRIYVPCTRNERRAAEGTRLVYAGREIDAGPDAANPRPDNRFGHIIEIREAQDDHTSEEFSWEVFLLAGDPSGEKLITDLDHVKQDSAYYAGYGKPEQLSPIGSPDNIGFDSAGNLWVVTDGPQPSGGNDGCWMCPTTGPERGRLQQFMSGPKGAEICGCQFSDDGETFFLSIQHPGEGGSVTEPVSHWPDGPGMQPRSSVIAITRT
jgi:secreted PhoX family phosphatase